MKETRYEINWHNDGDLCVHHTVTPITVIREGVLPGCSGVSITAIDADGRKFNGTPCNYFKTEAEAWAAVRKELEEAIAAAERDIAKQIELVAAWKKALEDLK
jgi:hypothetical protein